MASTSSVESQLNSNLLEYEDRLYPGKMSEIGFLQPHQRLAEVLAADAKTVEAKGITMLQLGSMLERLVLIATSADSEITVVDGEYEIKYLNATLGFQSCPFHELDPTPIYYGSGTISVRKIATGETFEFEALVAHLVKEHGFCEGPGTPYRLDLSRGIEFFSILPGRDYAPQFEDRQTWSLRSAHGDIAEAETFAGLAIATYTAPQTRGYLFPGDIPVLSGESWTGDRITDWRKCLERNDLQFGAWNETDRQKREAKLAAIESRIRQFQAGILADGLNLMLLEDGSYFEPSNGLTVEISNNQITFTIPELSLSLSQIVCHRPMIRTFSLETRRYLI